METVIEQSQCLKVDQLGTGGRGYAPVRLVSL